MYISRWRGAGQPQPDIKRCRIACIFTWTQGIHRSGKDMKYWSLCLIWIQTLTRIFRWLFSCWFVGSFVRSRKRDRDIQLSYYRQKNRLTDTDRETGRSSNQWHVFLEPNSSLVLPNIPKDKVWPCGMEPSVDRARHNRVHSWTSPLPARYAPYA